VINLGLILLSVLLKRRVFVDFGVVGVFACTARLANELFAGFVLLPFALSAAGLAIDALGILYAKNHPRLERAPPKDFSPRTLAASSRTPGELRRSVRPCGVSPR
jgi:hypothetical protein